MKWVKTENDLTADGVNKNDSRQTSAFKRYDNEILLFNDLKRNYVEWITYPIDPNKSPFTNEESLAILLYGKVVHNPLPDFKNRKALRMFEVFCGGFLYYHDVVFKKYPNGRGYSDETGNPEWKDYPIDFIDPHEPEKQTIIPGKAFEHYIYFQWLPVPVQNPGKKTGVTIFINSTPQGFNPNPPPPPPPPPPESNP